MLKRRLKVIGKPKLIRWEDGCPVIRVRYRWTGGPVKQITRRIRKLLSDGDGNTKLRKGKEYHSAGLALSPADQANMGTMCASASAGCIGACLDETGLGIVFQNIRISRVLKTAAFKLCRAWFIRTLSAEIEAEQRKADALGKPLAIRLNVFSDVQWEKIAPELFETHPRVEFYDYTKHAHRVGQLRPNYWVTFSRSEINEAEALRVLADGNNVAVVFIDSLPAEWNGVRVIDGDVTDLRFDDERGCVVGLKLKAGTNEHRNEAIAKGFAV